MLANVAIIQGTVQYFVAIVNVTIDIFDGVPEFIPNDHLSLPLLALLHQIHDDDGTAVPLQQILKVSLGRLVRGVHPVQHDGRLGHRDARLLRPKRGYAPAYLKVAREHPLRTPRALVVNYLLVLDVVGDLAAVADSALEVPSAGEVPRAPGKEHEV